MIRILENQEKKLYHVSSSDWEAVVLSKDAIEAAGQAFEEAFDTFGDSLNLSSCVNVVECSNLQKNLADPEKAEFETQLHCMKTSSSKTSSSMSTQVWNLES